MPYFSIFAPLSGGDHYYTATLIGFQRGLLIRWAPDAQGWKPKVVHLSDIAAFDGSRLSGYCLVDPEAIDAFALEAMTGS